MKHDPLAPPPPPAAEPGDSKRNGPRWSGRKTVEFLRLLAATHSVTHAARAVGISRQSAYKLRSRLRGKAFGAAWDEAFHQNYVNLPYAALDHALNGIEVPHCYKGGLVGISRRYDERPTSPCSSSAADRACSRSAVTWPGRRGGVRASRRSLRASKQKTRQRKPILPAAGFLAPIPRIVTLLGCPINGGIAPFLVEIGG